MAFRINNKTEFLLTYSYDYLGLLTLLLIIQFFTTNKDWQYIISFEHGHEKGDIHGHFHVYLKYVGNNKRGFSKRGKDAQKVFDIPLPKPIYRKEIDGHNQYTLLETPGYELVTHAKCNIKFKGDKEDENCKNTFKMIDYVTKQRKTLEQKDWQIESNFEWQKVLETLSGKHMKFYRVDKTGNPIIESRQDNLEFTFTTWLRDQLKLSKSVEEIKNDIMSNNDYFFIYSKRKINWDSVITDFCKIRDTEKPKPQWERTYIIPKLLKDYIDYIDNWVKSFYEAETDDKGLKLNLPERPKGLWMTGESRSGKTSLAISLGSFSYFNNMWNLLNYSYNCSLNIMDDYKGIMTTDDFATIKPWVGSQYTFTASDKYIKKINIVNGKPLIWLSNKPLDKQVLDEDDRNYVRKNMTVIELGNYDLYSPKDTRTIGGYTNWVNWDPKTTWFYNNIINLQNNEPEASSIEISENQAELLEDQSSEVIETNSDNEEDIPAANSNVLGRPKRPSIFEIQISTPGNKRRRI